ncbi:hypothetical protein T4D_4049 [Trichinella pseudospiralis]|uniref:Uncharacterized protein n=1 Tax=Trichinella pseudospiralis TaxID=6337 RepID=A0A0V1F9D1_TRIPS|nr:hypothetical protein T4D_4049 [Trichinella pseudospiralis]
MNPEAAHCFVTEHRHLHKADRREAQTSASFGSTATCTNHPHYKQLQSVHPFLPFLHDSYELESRYVEAKLYYFKFTGTNLRINTKKSKI